MKKIIIGIDASNIRGGGGITHLVEIMNSMSELQYINNIIIWGNNKLLDKIIDNKLIKKNSNKFINGNFLYRLFWQIFLLGNFAKKNNCDILFIPGTSFTTSFRPIVTMSQNLLPFEKKEYLRYRFSIMYFKLLLLKTIQKSSLFKSTGVIFLTNYAAKIINTKNSINNYKIIPHGIGINFFTNPKNQKNISDYSFLNPFRIIYVSNIDFYKHQWNVAKAVSYLRDEGYPIRLDMYGPSYKPAFKILSRTLDLLDVNREYLIYAGAKPHNEISKCIHKSDLFLFASSCENLPNVLLEGMASGLPILSSNLGPMPEILEDAGLFFNPEKVDEIISSLKKYLDSPILRYNMSIKSHNIAKKYSWKTCSNKTFEYLYDLSLKSNI